MRLWLMLMFAVIQLFAGVGAVSAKERVALVIGNGDYQNATALPNPANDAEDISVVLEAIGFTVIKGIDLDHDGMEAKLREYVTAMRDAEVALFYYSGHGIQVAGKNYLVPVDARLEDETSLDFEMIDADKVFGYMGGNDRIALAFLDACRDNPLARRLASSMGATRSADVGVGFATPQTAGTGLFIGFATAPNDVALDGDGANSPFTTAFLKHVATPGLEINQVMTRVKADVRVATNDDQRPWTNSDLSTDVFLVASTKQIDVLPAPDSDLPPDEAHWRLIGNATRPEVFGDFLERYPASVHRAEAEARIALLSEPVPVPEAPVTPDVPSALFEGRRVSVIVPSDIPVTLCDELAADPEGHVAGVQGVYILHYTRLKSALQPCRDAMEKYPDEPRFAYQYGRALYGAGRSAESDDYIRRAADAGYQPALVSQLSWDTDLNHPVLRKALEAGLSYALLYAARTVADRGNIDTGLIMTEAPSTGGLSEFMKYAEPAAEAGSPGAMVLLGTVLGTAYRDNAGRRQWLETAAAAGSAEAMMEIGYSYLHGESGAPQDWQQAVVWLERGAEAGYGNAWGWLVIMFNGSGRVNAPHDPDRAADLILRAVQALGVSDGMPSDDEMSLETKRIVQRLLQDKGYYNGAIDGRFGPGTRAALETYAGA